MAGRLNYKKIAFAVMVSTLLLCVLSLILLGGAETAVRGVPRPQRLLISGSYYTAQNPTPRILPENGVLDLPDTTNRVTATGQFNREVPVGEIISFRVDNVHLRLWVDGELIFEYGEPYSVLPYVRSSGNGWVYVSSPGITVDQEVRLELQNLYTNHTNATYKTFFRQLYSGNPAVHISQSLRASLVQSIMAIFILLMGILELGYALALSFGKTNANEYYTLAGMSITCGTWFLINFDTLELFLPSPIVNNSIQHLSLSLALCYTLHYMATQLTGRRKTVVRATAMAAVALTVAAVFCQHLGKLDYYDFTTPLYLLLGFSELLMLGAIFLEGRAHGVGAARRKLYPLCMLLLGALIDVLLGWLGLVPFLVFETAFCLFTCCQLYAVLRSVTDSARDRANLLLLKEDRERQQRLLEYQMLLTRSTKGLYENIYELDITHDRASDETTRKYFESLGIPADTPFGQAVKHIAETQIHPDYRRGYVETFAPENVIKQYSRGIDTLQYDFLIRQDGENYYWMRIDARIFFWNHDQSVRMITYRQNVDDEKRQELELLNRADQDSLTGLLNRDALERRARELLARKRPERGVCCIILDIDDFKTVNDTFGHMAGDFVLTQLAVLLQARFSHQELVGRLGGDEFLVVAPCSHIDEIKAQIAALMSDLSSAHTRFEKKLLPLAVSVGIAWLPGGTAIFEEMYKCSDAALYQSKNEGKGRCTVHTMEER